jgi:hypothetical protein
VASVLFLAVLTTALSVVHPPLLMLVPLAVLMLALPPRRPVMVAFALFVLIMFFRGEATDSLWYFERGWVLILSAWFVVAIVALPRSSFLPRALLAVFAAIASAALLVVLNPGGATRIDARIAERLRAGANQVVAALQSVGGAARFGGEVGETVTRAVELQAMLYPGLLALASVTALGVAWWAFRRLGVQEARPLGALREFRFPDSLVWLLIAGIILLVLPLDGFAERAGSNVLLFMAALYAVRGAAVLLVLGGAPGPLGVLLGALVVLLLYPLVVAATFFVGLTDTWLDIRTRRAARGSSG